MSLVARRSDRTRRFFGIRECWRNDKEEIVIFRAYRGRDDVLLPEIVVARYGVELKHEIVLIDLCDNCIKLKLKKWENKIWIPSGEVDKLFSFYKFKSVVKIGLMHVTSVIFFVAPVDRRSKPIYMDFYAFHYVKDIVDISLLKLIQDELGLNYFDGLDDVSYGIKDNEMHGNMKSSGVQRIQKNTSNETTIKKRCVAEHHSKRLTEYDMKADRFYICCEFARLLLKSGGLEQWKFTVKGSKITKTFAMHVLKSKGRNREYKIGPKWKDFVKMHKLRPGYLCVFRSDSNKNHLVQGKLYVGGSPLSMATVRPLSENGPGMATNNSSLYNKDFDLSKWRLRDTRSFYGRMEVVVSLAFIEASLGVKRQVVMCFWRLTLVCDVFLAFYSRMQHGTGIECRFASSKLK
ncbi:uncharacterized protein DS421_9g270070 [Arachis hypogaea]|nr:uncharacterized protein DS421_9g270070 [Arachis hypogaea]